MIIIPKNTFKISIPFYLTFAIFILLQSDLLAQFILSGELRPRTEFRHGYSKLADVSSKTAIFISQRSRINFHFNHEKYKIGMSIQDVRVWGDEEQLKDISSVVVHEAWGEISFNQHLSVRLGRQEFVYDDHRLLGNVNWVQQARSHDAALLKFHIKDWQADFAAAYNNQGEELFRNRYTLNNYRSLFFLWINKPFNKILKISALGIADGFQAADSTVDETIYRYTFGAHFQFMEDNLGLNGSLYYQSGQDRNYTSVNAYMFALKGIYKHERFSINAGIDFLSGTNGLSSNNSEINTFNTLYATNHKFYGLMDYFINIPLHTLNGGLKDLFTGISYKITEEATFLINYHNFSLSNNISDPANPGKAIIKELGSEIDIIGNYNFHRDLNIKAGFSVMFPTTSMEVLKGGDKSVSQNWAWLMVTFKPEFFKINLAE